MTNNWKKKLLELREEIPKESYPNMFYSKLVELIENIIDEANRPKFSKSGLDVFNEKINTEIKEVNIAKIIKNNQDIFPVVYWSSLTNILREVS